MTTLTGKQKRFLRSLGQHAPDMATIGREGLSQGTLGHLRKLLAEHELVKLRLTDDEQGGARKEAAAEVAQAVDAAVAGVVGRTVLLYRPNPDLPADRQLRIPE